MKKGYYGRSQEHGLNARGITTKIEKSTFYKLRDTPFKTDINIKNKSYQLLYERSLEYWNPNGGRDIIWVHMLYLEDKNNKKLHVVGIEDINGELYYVKGFEKQGDATKHWKESFKKWVTRYWGTAALKELKKPDDITETKQ